MPLGSRSQGAIPVEAILKLALDKSGAKEIQDFLDKHEETWGRVEKSVGRIGQSVEGLSRYALGLAGIAGLGAVAGNFMQTSQAGSNVALANGLVTGGPGTWHPYGQALLSAQSKTGVDRLDIAQGLIMALQSVGGNLSPQQASVLGGLIAGYGQTTGMSPAQVAQVTGSLLQASNKSLTQANALGVMSTLSGGLTAFPGSQAAPMLGLLSQLGVSQALGSGPAGGYTMNLHGLTAAVNSAAQANSIWRSPSLTGGAINSISGGLQSAYGNPSQEAFMQMAGISYGQQRQGFTPQNMQAIMRQATSLYGTGTTRDIFLRSMFGLQGADLLEQFAPGTHAASLLQHNLAHHGSPRQLQHAIDHAQQRTTPGATANRWGADLLGWLEASPLHAAAGLGGALALKKGLGSVFKYGGRGLSKLLSGGAGEDLLSVPAGAEGGLLGDLLGGFGGVATAGIGTAIAALAFPDSISVPGSGNKDANEAVRKVLAQAQRKFGRDVTGRRAQEWMWNQFGYRSPVQMGPHGPGTNVPKTSFWLEATGQGESPHGATVAQQMLSRLFQSLGGAQDPITTFSQAAQKLLQAANELNRPHGTGASYQSGSTSAMPASLGTAGIQQIGATAPGLEFAALTSGAGSGSGSGGGGGFVSLLGDIHSAAGGVSGSTGVGSITSGGSWAPCMMTWYDPALGGTNSGSGKPEPNGPTASGQHYSPTAMICAAPPSYPFGTQIEFQFAGKSVVCEVIDRGGAIQGNHFDLGRGPATALGIISKGVAYGRFRTVKTGSGTSSKGHSGGGSTPGKAAGGGVLTALASAGGSSGAGMPSAGTVARAVTAAAAAGGGLASGHGDIHVHVHVDGHEVHKSRVLRGHHKR